MYLAFKESKSRKECLKATEPMFLLKSACCLRKLCTPNPREQLPGALTTGGETSETAPPISLKQTICLQFFKISFSPDTENMQSHSWKGTN